MKTSHRHASVIGKTDYEVQNRLSDYIAADRFDIGDVYLFHKTDPRCPKGSSLWGMFDKCEDGKVFLESSSRDCEVFENWCRLPDDYVYCRLATRTELHQYVFEQTWCESRQILGAAR